MSEWEQIFIEPDWTEPVKLEESFFVLDCRCRKPYNNNDGIGDLVKCKHGFSEIMYVSKAPPYNKSYNISIERMFESHEIDFSDPPPF